MRAALDLLSDEQLGGADRAAIIRRLRVMLNQLEVGLYTSNRLRRSRGLRWSWLGEIWEVLVFANRALWNEIFGYARLDLQRANQLLKEHGGAGLVNGRGVPLEQLPERPGAFPETPVLLVNVRLIAPGEPPGSLGKKYVDAIVGSLQGPKEARWLFSASDNEIKVPNQASELGPQVEKAPGRREHAGYLVADVIDSVGRVVGTETIAIDRIVIDPRATRAQGITANLRGIEKFSLKGGRGRRGASRLHWRYEIPLSIEAAQQLVKAMFSPEVLRPKK